VPKLPVFSLRIRVRIASGATVRASFSIYNTKAEIDEMTEGLKRIVNFMKP